MAVIPPPSGSLTFVGALFLPLVLGFLVGVVARAALKIGIALVLIVFVLVALGYIEPNQLIQPVVQQIESGPAVINKVNEIVSYLPYSSLGFIVGFVVGFFKG